MDYFRIEMTPPDRFENEVLRYVGPLTAHRTSLIDQRTGVRPPAWWRGDEEASRTSQEAFLTLRRRR